MAGDEVAVDSNAFCMIHNPWTMAIGNANDLQKEIDTLEKCKSAMMGYYRRHAKVDEASIEQYLDAETWFLGAELADVFDVRVIECDEVLDIAAKFDLTKFNNIPRGLIMKNKVEQADDIEKKEEEEVVEEVAEETPAEPDVEEPKKKKPDEGENPPTEEETTEEEEEQPQDSVEELKARIAELEAQLAECQKELEKKDSVSKDECEKRVSGMQASMQKQVNDFKGQLESKEKELVSAKAEITSLNQKLEESVKELSEKASALAEKEEALAKLNANVNAHAEELPTMKDGLAKCATPAEKVAFLKSGKYVR
jgi:uncharacterized phage infection (PIP) family protein YhgE